MPVAQPYKYSYNNLCEKPEYSIFIYARRKELPREIIRIFSVERTYSKEQFL